MSKFRKFAVAAVATVTFAAAAPAMASADEPVAGDYCSYIDDATGDVYEGTLVYNQDTDTFDCVTADGDRSSWGRSSWGRSSWGRNALAA